VACWYRFGADQLMFIRGKAPRARYWSLCLYNVWMESFEYRAPRVSLNHTQVLTDAQGNYEICLAHSDPGHPNWIDTTGHTPGTRSCACCCPRDPWKRRASRSSTSASGDARPSTDRKGGKRRYRLITTQLVKSRLAPPS
jgi:hypothetical protein